MDAWTPNEAEQEMWDAIAASDPGPERQTTVAQGTDGYVWATNPASDECDRCGGKRELYHNEATGMSLCDECDAVAAGMALMAPTATGTVRFKRLRNGAWGVTGPSALLTQGAEVAVTKKSGATTVVTVKRVLWSGDDKAIATIAR